MNSNQAVSSSAEVSEAKSVRDLVIQRAWRSLTSVQEDRELSGYLMDTIHAVAQQHGKTPTEFNMDDVKRVTDYIHALASRYRLNQVTLKTLLSAKRYLSVGADISNLVTLSESLAGILQGHYAWLVWHVSKKVVGPRLKRAVAVYFAGSIAAILYGGAELMDGAIESDVIDPIFLTMDRPMLEALSKTLEVYVPDDTSETDLIESISQTFAKEGKDQAIDRSWFPRDASSYLEAIVVVAKLQKIDIRGLTEVAGIEAAICGSVFNRIWKQLPEEEKSQIASEWTADGSFINPSTAASLAGLGAIGAAQLGGFGVYTMASTVVAFSSQALGIGLPFTFYTGLSSGIAAAIGPVGLGVTAIPIVFQMMKAKPERLIGAIALISAWRAKLSEEEKKPVYRDRRFLWGGILFAAGAATAAAVHLLGVL